MIEPSISILMPTLGRPSIKKMLDSLVPQMNEQDELIVIADGLEAFERASVVVNDELASRIQVFVGMHHDPRSKFGNAQRNYARDLAACDLMWNVDDDDLVEPNALDTIRSVMAEDRSPCLFRMHCKDRILWIEPKIVLGDCSGQMMVAPNRPDIPLWPPRIDIPDDYLWLKEIEKSHSIRFRPEIIYRLTQHSEGAYHAE